VMPVNAGCARVSELVGCMLGPADEKKPLLCKNGAVTVEDALWCCLRAQRRQDI
jgi:hypothetical protein